MNRQTLAFIAFLLMSLASSSPTLAQVGRRFPFAGADVLSER
jgi:hypothetical protein